MRIKRFRIDEKSDRFYIQGWVFFWWVNLPPIVGFKLKRDAEAYLMYAEACANGKFSSLTQTTP